MPHQPPSFLSSVSEFRDKIHVSSSSWEWQHHAALHHGIRLPQATPHTTILIFVVPSEHHTHNKHPLSHLSSLRQSSLISSSASTNAPASFPARSSSRRYPPRPPPPPRESPSACRELLLCDSLLTLFLSPFLSFIFVYIWYVLVTCVCYVNICMLVSELMCMFLFVCSVCWCAREFVWYV